MNTDIPAGRRDAADILAIGFGTTVALWAVGYFSRLPVGGAAESPRVLAPSVVVLVLMLGCLLAGGFVAGRFTSRGWRGGLCCGVLTGVLNLLVLGILLATDQPNVIRPSALMWVPGWLLAASAAGALGAVVGGVAAGCHAHAANPERFGSGDACWRRRGHATLAQTVGHNWRMRFVLVAFAATLLLLAVGGMVTGYRAGLAVVDWPNTYGYNMFLYPLARMTGGIYFEHAHRLIGSLVGLTTLVLAAHLHRTDSRGWLKALAWLALAMVIVQGVLGGLRVTGSLTLSTSPEDTAPNLTLAITHGILGQAFFSLLAAVAAFTSTTWRTGPQPIERATAGTDRFLGAVLVAALLIQLMIGAALRHLLDWGLILHIGVGIVVALAAVGVGVRAWGFYGDLLALPRLGLTLLVLVGVQLALGVAALVAVGTESPHRPPAAWQVAVTTAHQTSGAGLLACAVALAAWNYRLLRPQVARLSAGGVPSISRVP